MNCANFSGQLARLTEKRREGESIQASGKDDEVDLVHIRAETHGSSKNPTGPIFTGSFEELGELVSWWNRRDEINAVLALMKADQLARLTQTTEGERQ